MKVLGINGSHRKDGNTSVMVCKALEVCVKNGLETEQVDLVDYDVRYCTVCDACRKEYACSQEDDGIGLLDRMRGADAIIIASPTYFGGVSGRLRTLFDRTLPLRRNGMMLSGKIGGALAVGGSRNGGQEYVIHQIHAAMLIHEMMIVGDSRTAHFGGIATAHAPGSVLDDDVGMTTVLNLAENICARLRD
ncbi:MAG: flavodoxin family protein [Candidatus Altiarchaeota archaeon]